MLNKQIVPIILYALQLWCEMTMLVAICLMHTHAFQFGPHLLTVQAFEFPPDFPFGDHKFEDIDEDDYPYLRKPTDVDWTSMPELPEDYDPENDPEVLAWREAQKPPVIQNAQFVSEIKDLVFPRFHFYYMSHCKYSDAALTAFKEFAEHQYTSGVPLFFTDCGRWNTFCADQQVDITRAPLMAYYALNGQKTFAEVEMLNNSEQFAQFTELRNAILLSVHPSDFQYCAPWAGLLQCRNDSHTHQTGSQRDFDIYVNRTLFQVQGISSYNYEHCLQHKIFVYGSEETFNDFKAYQNKYALLADFAESEPICLLDYSVFGPFAYMTWGVFEQMLPVVIMKDGILLPSSPVDVFE